MKLCLACGTSHKQANWQCPDCQFAPCIIEGYPAFSPGLATHNDGMPLGFHHLLNKMQEQSFWFRGRNQLIQSAINRYFPNAMDVLEIGCGTGYVLSGIRRVLPIARLTATEIFSYGLAYAAHRISPPCEFLQVDARNLPFRNEFDLVGAFDVLEHIEEDTKVLQNMRDSLKPGGGVIITVPQHPWLWSGADDMACHKRRYTRKQLSGLLQQLGFEILQDTSFMFFLLPIMLLQRFLAAAKANYDQTQELSLPKLLDKSFAALLACERFVINLGLSFPVGGSRFIVARHSS